MNPLREAVSRLAQGRRDEAASILSAVGAGARGGEASLQESLFVRALDQNLFGARQIDPNLYCRDLDVRQIDLFEELARALPLMAVARECANAGLARCVEHADDAVIIDLGIGSGRQMQHLIEYLARHPRQGRRLTLVGVDVDEKGLHAALHDIAALAAQRGLPLLTVALAMPMEQLDFGVLRAITVGSSVAINAAFALHHVASSDAKDQVLRMLHALSPDVFVLTEPDSDHENDDIAVRFDNAWLHFGRVFRMIDACCPSDDIRYALKTTFFAREIDDILGAFDSERRERHETFAMWAARLRRAGFRPSPVIEAPAIRAPVSARSGPGWSLFGLEGEAIVAQLCVDTGPTR